MKTTLKGIFTLLLAFVVQLSFAQEKTISGTVSDQNNVPLGGVNILVQGTTNGTQSDFDGNYSITASVGETLVFTYIGLKQATAVVGSSNVINVQMQEDAQALEEVVVTGLGIKREKKAVGYAQQSVQGEELQKGKQIDINNALAGKIAGVQIVGNSSSRFGNSEIKLRGETGVLYVVDGVFVYSISDINTDNIADMSVLKGASATAVYGPDGRNGVVIITSKTGKKGQTIFSIDQTTMINSVSALPDYQNEYGGGYSQEFNTFTFDPSLDPAEWASFNGDLYPDFWADESWGPRMNGQQVRHWDSWIPGTPEFGQTRAWSPNEDNIRDFYETALTANTNFAFSKADEGYSIRTNLTHIDQEGIIPNSKQRTINFSVNASMDINEKLGVQTVVNIQDRTTKNNPDAGYANLGSNMNQWWQRQLDMDNLKSYERNGQVVSWNIRGPRDPRPLYWDMPYFQTNENLKHDFKNATFGKFAVTYKFNENLDAVGEIRSTVNSYRGDDRGTTKSLLDPAFYSEYQYRNTREQYFGMLNFNKKLLDNKLDVQASLGGDIASNEYNYLSASTQGDLTIPEFYNLGGSKDPVSTSTNLIKSETRGAFLKTSFGFNNIAYLDASYRLDWSSTAKADQNKVETYGISGSFLIHELFPANEYITFAKLRAGFASAPYFPNPYNISQVYNAGDLYQGNGTLSVPNTQANPNLVGGTRDEIEIGAELRTLKGRFNLDVTYFDRVDSDLPVSVNLDGSTGYTGITINSGKNTSKGWEISLNTIPLKSKDFQFDLGGNIGTLEKRVEEIYPGVDSYDISSYTSNMKLQARVGEEYGLFYGSDFGRHTDGSIIFTSTDKFARNPNQMIGSLLPDFTYGITTNFKYKNLELYLGFDGQVGGLYYSRTERYFDHSGLSAATAGLNDKGNPLRDPVENGGGIRIQGVLQTGTDSNGSPISDGTIVDKYIDPQDYFNLGNLGNVYSNNVHDATYLKLRTIKLTYNFSKTFIESVGLSSAQLSLLGNNVWLINSDLPWIDPSEMEKRSGVNWAEAGMLPMTSQLGLNLKITF